MVEATQFHAAHRVAPDHSRRHERRGGYLPWVSVYAYPQRLDGKPVQHIQRGNIKLHRAIHRQFKRLPLAGYSVLWIIKRPQPLLRGYLDNQRVRRRGNGVLVKAKHPPDEKKETKRACDSQPPDLESRCRL